MERLILVVVSATLAGACGGQSPASVCDHQRECIQSEGKGAPVPANCAALLADTTSHVRDSQACLDCLGAEPCSDVAAGDPNVCGNECGA